MKRGAKIEIRHDSVVFNGGLWISFQRTLRIPDDGKRYPLPPGLGSFPVRRVDDYADAVPAEWRERGGLFLPMFQREAMWLHLCGPPWKPRAVKVAVGKVCALTGKPWSEELHDDKQDYLVSPPQPWLDGIAGGKGMIRQFVAMPLGTGYTVEGQVTGEERFGGIQIKVVEPKPGRFPDEPPAAALRGRGLDSLHVFRCEAAAPPQARARGRRVGAMGLGAGGRMKQKIYPDPHGLETWDLGNSARVFVHIVNSELWREITGEAPLPTPVTAKTYASYKLPWFDLYDEGAATLDPSDVLADVKSIKEMDQLKFENSLQDDDPVAVGPVKRILLKMAARLGGRDGEW
jgi:hypothetical protein